MKALIPFALAAMLVGCGGDGSTGNSDGTDGSTATDTTDGTDGSTADVTDSADEGTGGGQDEGTPADDVKPPTDVIVGPPPDVGQADTGKSEPPATCREAIECWGHCNTDGCRAACLEGADQAILDTMESVTTCVGEQPGCSTAPIQCLVEECFDAYRTCAFDGNAGDGKCSTLNECLLTCTDGACEDACFYAASVEAQKNYVKLQVCVQNYAEANCEEFNDECKKQAETSAFCSTQYDFCLGDKS